MPMASTSSAQRSTYMRSRGMMRTRMRFSNYASTTWSPWCPYALHSWASCAPVMRREPHTPLGGCVLHQSSLCMGLGAVPYLLLEQGLLPSQLPGEFVRRAAPRRSGAAGSGDQPVSRAGCAHS